MNKHAALNIILQCAQEYEIYLKNQNLMFVMINKKGECSFFESSFRNQHFKHLTGVKTEMNGADFYRACLDGNLSEKQFEILKSTTEIKLQVLSHAMHIEKTARMCGEFNNNGFDLYTQKVVGNIQVCLGMVKDQASNYYVPNTVLKSDIRQRTIPPFLKIACIFKKGIKDEKYNQVCATGKNIKLSEIKFPIEVINKLNDDIKDRCKIIATSKVQQPQVHTRQYELTSNEKKQLIERAEKAETELKAVSEENQKRITVIHTTNAILNANPQLKKDFIMAKKAFMQNQSLNSSNSKSNLTSDTVKSNNIIKKPKR